MSRVNSKKSAQRKKRSRRIRRIPNNFQTPPSLILKRSASWRSPDPKVEERNHEILNQFFPGEMEKEPTPPPRAQSAPSSIIPPKTCDKVSNLKPLHFVIAGLAMIIPIMFISRREKVRPPPNWELLVTAMDPLCDFWEDLDGDFFTRMPNIADV